MSKIEFSMTEQELKEKIVKIIKQNGVYNGNSMHQDYYVVNDEELANALVAAGIGDVKETEQRAEVTEKALRVLARKFVISVFPNGDWRELIEQFVSKAKKQAEKELQEERK